MKLMKISQKGIDLIKAFEGCKLFAYRDSVGVLTIGYGNTSHAKAGMAITQKQAEDFLKEDLQSVEKVLNALGVNFTQNEFDSLCSWIFNLGVTNFNTSTMKKYILANKADIDITDQMVRWYRAGGKPMLGLKRRRCAEANMWLGYTKYYVDENENIKKK